MRAAFLQVCSENEAYTFTCIGQFVLCNSAWSEYLSFRRHQKASWIGGRTYASGRQVPEERRGVAGELVTNYLSGL